MSSSKPKKMQVKYGQNGEQQQHNHIMKLLTEEKKNTVRISNES